MTERCEVVRTPRNLGYAAANNIGIRRARELEAKYVLLVNDDAYLMNDCLEKLVAAIEANPNAGAVGPLVLTARRPGIVQSPGGMWRRERLWTYHRGAGERDRGQYTTLLPSFYIDGCCVLLRLSALDRVGFLDEDFFLYYEETELCVRLHNAGYSCFVVPWAKVEHEGGEGGAQADTLRTYYSTRDRFLFVRKTTPGWRRSVHLMWVLGTEATIVRSFFENPRNPTVWARAKGIIDGICDGRGFGPAWVHTR